MVEDHDIHLSVTEISIVDNRVEVVSKIFLDDLQSVMGLVPGEELPDDYVGADEMIQIFINENLSIHFNDQPLVLKLKLAEPALPAVWATFESDKVQWATTNSFLITNKMMNNLYDDQRNIVKLDINGDQQEEVFDFQNEQVIFIFK